jgi:hypothetical protein
MEHVPVGKCLVVLCAVATGCTPIETVSTEVLLRDPSAVSLEKENGDEVLPASSDPIEAPFDEGRIDTGPESSAEFHITARREESHAISLSWSTSLPLTAGERYTILPANGSITLAEPLTSVVTPEMRAASSLAFRWCTTIASSTSRYSSGYHIDPRRCTDLSIEETGHHGLGSSPYILEMPWSNVAEIRERTRVDKGSAWLIVGASTVTFGTFSALFLSFKNSSFKGGLPTKIALTSATAAIGLSFDFAMLPTLLASDHDVVIHH